MKNVHLISTDKPSRLRIGNNRNFVFGITQISIVSKNDSFTNQHIYITSNEEIKEGDWFYCPITNIVNQCESDYHSKKLVEPKRFKIILTTDQDLIKDGVQAIDDEFLEWFVKNPSCEEVEVEKTFVTNSGLGYQEYAVLDSNFKVIEINTKIPQESYYLGKVTILNTYEYVIIYKTIIPKEEPKYPIGGYAPGNYMCNCSTCKTQFKGDKRAVQCEPCSIAVTKEEPKQVWEQIIETCGGKEEFMKSAGLLPKQETLDVCFNSECSRCYEEYNEEPKQATDREPYWDLVDAKAKQNNTIDIDAYAKGVLDGVNWQQERMYSEKEVLEIVSNCDGSISQAKKWFEQFKKK